MDEIRALRLSPILVLALGLLTACASGPPPGPSPAELAGRSAQTIVVSPFNVVTALPPELEGSTKMVRRALVDHLKAHGKTVKVMGFRAGRDLWAASMKEVRDSGQKRNFDNAARVYARKIAEHLEFDAVIVPSLFVQNAKSRAGVARWDGAEQRVEQVGTFKGNFFLQGQRGTLNVRAASLFVQILDRQGERVHTEKRGLELIQHFAIVSKKEAGYSSKVENELTMEDDRPPVDDVDRVREGVAAALVPFLPAEIPATISPPSEAAPASE